MKNSVYDIITPFDGRKGKRLSKEVVSDFRFFGFYIGNETLEQMLGEKVDTSIVFEPSDALGNLYAFRLFGNYDKKGERFEQSRNDSSITLDYIKCLNEKKPVHFEFPSITELSDKNDWRSVITRFMTDFGNRKLDTAPLKDFVHEDYAYDIIDYGSGLEVLTTVFFNILRMDNDFNVINEEWCRHRASQYIRSHHDDSYRVIPPFKTWETTLWL